MNRRTRIAATALALAALLGACYVGASAWLGRQFEQGWQASLDRLADRQGSLAALLGAARVTERSYQRHLLGAQATLVLEVPRPLLLTGADAAAAAAAQPLRLHLQSDVRHGPLTGAGLAAAVVHTTLLRVEGAGDALRQAFAQASPPRITSVFGLGGSVRNRIQLPPGEVTLSSPLLAPGRPDARPPATLLARWQQVDYDVTSSEQGRRLQGSARMPHMLLQVATGLPRVLQLQLDEQQTQFDLRYQGPHWLMAVGDTQGSAGRIELRALDPASAAEPASAPASAQPEAGAASTWLLLQNVRLESRSTQQGTLLGATYHLDGKGSAGGVPMDNLHAELTLDKLDLQALAELQAQLQHLAASAQGGGQAPVSGDAADSSAKLEALATRLMDAGPSYTFKISSTLDGQTGSIGYGMHIHPSPTASAPNTATAVPLQMQLGQRLALNASLRLPKTWLPIIGKTFFRQDPDDSEDPTHMLTQMAQGFAAEGWLRDEGNAYATEAQLEKGGLHINGRPLAGH